MLALFGFFIFFIFLNQIISGVMLAFSLETESMNIPLIREEEDLENNYCDDFFFLHERGVDLVYVSTLLHLARKLYLNVYDNEQESAWKTGAFSFLLLQGVVFFGLVLCCTHLSEVTLTIAANAVNTFFLFTGKPDYWFFTDRQLNTDTIIRLAYGHYVTAFVLVYLSVGHGVDMHYDWKSEQDFTGSDAKLHWWDEVAMNELGLLIDLLILVALIIVFNESVHSPVSYEFFMWGDIGMVPDIRFYGVAPHWYFRPYMAWLIACPHHTTGILGLVFFFVSLFFQPNINSFDGYSHYKLRKTSCIAGVCRKPVYFSNYYLWRRRYVSDSFWHQITYALFFIAFYYTFTYLPYGRFFNRLQGNDATLIAYFIIFSYLGGYFGRDASLLELDYSLLINYTNKK